MGLHIFREQLSGRPEVYTKTVDGLLKLIDSERRGDQVGRTAGCCELGAVRNAMPSALRCGQGGNAGRRCVPLPVAVRA
eukprot:1595693-Prymnesium_polylepis.2